MHVIVQSGKPHDIHRKNPRQNFQPIGNPVLPMIKIQARRAVLQKHGYNRNIKKCPQFSEPAHTDSSSMLEIEMSHRMCMSNAKAF